MGVDVDEPVRRLDDDDHAVVADDVAGDAQRLEALGDLQTLEHRVEEEDVDLARVLANLGEIRSGEVTANSAFSKRRAAARLRASSIAGPSMSYPIKLPAAAPTAQRTQPFPLPYSRTRLPASGKILPIQGTKTSVATA